MFVTNPANRKSNPTTGRNRKCVTTPATTNNRFADRKELAIWIENGLAELVAKFEHFETTSSRQRHFSR